MGGDLGPLGGADPAGPLRLQVPPELQPPGQQDQGHAAEHRHRGQQGKPRLFPGPGAGHHDQDPGHHERQPGRETGPAAGLVRFGLVHEAGPAGLIQLHPGDGRAAQDGRDRNEGPERNINAEQPGDQDAGGQQQTRARAESPCRSACR